MRKNDIVIRLLALALAFVMAIGFVGCSDGNDDPKQPEDQPGEKPEDKPVCPEGELPIVFNGETTYHFVRSDYANTTQTKHIAEVRAMLKERTGCELPMVTDWEDTDKSATEIIVGPTTRDETKAIKKTLSADEFVIRAVGDSIVILGGSDESTDAAIDYFTERYVRSAETGRFTLSKELNILKNMREVRLSENVSGSALKKQYSDYHSRYTETQLLSFDETEIPGETFGDCLFEIDSEYQKEGAGALRITFEKDYKDLCNVMWQKGNNGCAFECPPVDNRHAATLKLWLYVDDVDSVSCDHDAQYGAQSGQATFFFRVMDNGGRVYCWNHTLTRSGWHEVELSFNVHNGVSDHFDFGHITAFGLLYAGKEGTMIELDDLRLVEYQSDYQPEDAPDGGRLITDSEYDAFDGAMIQEWYGASYDLDDKMQGKSSLRCQGDNSVSDFRTIIANIDVPLNYRNDVLVVWMKIKKLSTVSSVFIEMNQVQDTHEYEQSFPLAELKKYGLSDKDDTWSRVVIPLNVFRQNLNPQRFGTDENITMHNFRFVVSASGNQTYDVHIDRVFVTTADQLSE